MGRQLHTAMKSFCEALLNCGGTETMNGAETTRPSEPALLNSGGTEAMNGEETTRPSEPQIDDFQKLLNAAVKGNAEEIEEVVELVRANPGLLSEKTHGENTCLHIASLCGHEDFCKKVLELQRPDSRLLSSLLSATNNENETPLLIAVKGGRDRDSKLAYYLLDEYCRLELNDALVKQDQPGGDNVLHHAIRNGYEQLALKLMQNQPDISDYRNKRKESPMFMAVLKGFNDVYDKTLENRNSIQRLENEINPWLENGINQLLGNENIHLLEHEIIQRKTFMQQLGNTIENSVFSGAAGYNALHAAVKYDVPDFVEKLVRTSRSVAKALAIQEDKKKGNPMQLTAHFNRDKILKIMLQCDRSLGYAISTDGEPLLFVAAQRGHVAFARALLEHCPDAPYRNRAGKTCLHEAVENDRIKFVEFILKKNSKLRKLVNMLDDDGESALHVAVKKCNPKMVSVLLNHPDIDKTVINNGACTAIWKLNEKEYLSKTINWNKIFWRIYYADTRAETDIYNLLEEMRNKVIALSRKDVKSLIKTYTSNTSLVAILIATVTFAAAFTLPGGYSSGAGSEGLPIMARKPAFQAFLIFDTLAMCSSLAVAFICVIARWTDFEFLLHYRLFTKKLMWFAYMATTLAFATGLYTVLEGPLHWLAIAICVVSALLPILTMLLGQWPILNLKIRYRLLPILKMLVRQRPIWKLKIRYPDQPFNTNFLDMV